MAWWGCHCAVSLRLVVQMNLLLRTPLNVRVCVILMMHRLSARLSFIVVRRMSFVDQYFSCASGCRGVARCLHMAWAWPARGLSRGRSRSFDWSSSSSGSAPRGTCSPTPCAPRRAILSARAACGGRGSGFRRCWEATEVGWACHWRRIT